LLYASLLEAAGWVLMLHMLLLLPLYCLFRYNWLMNFILCNNNAGLDQTGTFATATKCLKVRLVYG
jgi:hypothetical protein